MRRVVVLIAIPLFLALAMGREWPSTPVAAQTRSRPTGAYGWQGLKMTLAEFDKMMTDVSNWGRWGKDDVVGAVNLITPAKRKEAAALVKTGHSVSMSFDLLTEGFADQVAGIFKHDVAKSLGSDVLTMNTHGGAQAHLDTACHRAYKGKRFNGFPVQAESWGGCGVNNVLALKDGVITRGVLIDIPRLRGVPWLEPGKDVVYAEDIEAWEKKVGVRVRAGDAVFLRTGRFARRKALGPWDLDALRAGYHASVGYWFKARDIAINASDVGAGETVPSSVEGDMTRPMHTVTLVALGGYTVENLDLEGVADLAAKLGTWEFMVTVAPLRVPGGTGSPVNPIATF